MQLTIPFLITLGTMLLSLTAMTLFYIGIHHDDTRPIFGGMIILVVYEFSVLISYYVIGKVTRTTKKLALGSLATYYLALALEATVCLSTFRDDQLCFSLIMSHMLILCLSRLGFIMIRGVVIISVANLETMLIVTCGALLATHMFFLQVLSVCMLVTLVLWTCLAVGVTAVKAWHNDN